MQLWLALLSYPFFLLAPFNYVDFVWGFKYGDAPKPADVTARSLRVEAVASWLKTFSLFAFILLLCIRLGVPFRQLAGGRPTAKILLLSVAAVVVRLACQYLAWRSLPVERQHIQMQLLGDSTGVRQIAFVAFSALVQQLWIVACIVLFSNSGYSRSFSLLVIPVVFGLSHAAYRSAGVIAFALYGLGYVILFLISGSMVPGYSMHFVGNLFSGILHERALRSEKTL